jgi:hypothetical protein
MLIGETGGMSDDAPLFLTCDLPGPRGAIGKRYAETQIDVIAPEAWSAGREEFPFVPLEAFQLGNQRGFGGHAAPRDSLSQLFLSNSQLANQGPV